MIFAAREPIGVLVGTAINAIGFLVVLVIVLAFAAHRGWTSFNIYKPPSLAYVRHKWMKPVVIAAWAIPIVIPIIVGPWPGSVIAFGSGVWAGWLLGGWTARHELTFYRSAVLVLVVGLATAVGAGITGLVVGDKVNNYTFVGPTPQLPDGRYSLLGDSDGFVYLESCQRPGIVAVRQQDIATFTATQPSKAARSPTLIEILIQGASPKIGYRPEC